MKPRADSALARSASVRGSGSVEPGDGDTPASRPLADQPVRLRVGGGPIPTEQAVQQQELRHPHHEVAGQAAGRDHQWLVEEAVGRLGGQAGDDEADQCDRPERYDLGPKARSTAHLPNPVSAHKVGRDRRDAGGERVGPSSTPPPQQQGQLEDDLMIHHVDRRDQQVSAGSPGVAGEAGSGGVGAGVNHEVQGYPFDNTPLPMNVPAWALLLISLVLGLSACVGDDSPGADDSGVVVGTVDDTVASTTPSTATTAGDGAEPITTTTEPADQQAWIDAEFALKPIAATNQGLGAAVRPGREQLWVIERSGRVIVVSADGTDAEPAMVLDITAKVGTDGEGGLLGIDFSADGQLMFLSYTDTGGTSVISEFPVADDGSVDEGGERILLEVEQPFANHNGGQVTLGPDGFLYIALGDGGSGGDPLGSGQDTSTLLGAILRIDPGGATADSPYGIPAGNPFADGTGGRSEIWLYGVRNPWRFSFDAVTGDLWIGDVGQGEAEEIDFLPAAQGQPAGRGANLGWAIREAEQPFSGEAAPADLVDPIAWYGHDNGRCSVTGGYVYRGAAIPELAGVYVFGDFCTGEVFGLERSGGERTARVLSISDDVGQIVSFGEGPDNELLVFEADGTLSRLTITEAAADS